MNVVFVSNYYNHHQSSFCKEMYCRLNGSFYFVETQTFDSNRIQMGWEKMADCFVVSLSKQRDLVEELICNADIVIFGNCPNWLIKLRKKSKGITFFYSERLYKKKLVPWKLCKYFFTINRKYLLNKNCYLLCASAFAAYDFSLTCTFKKRCFKWGYFPAFYQFDINELMENKNHRITELLYVSRLIDWKHPELVVFVAKRLKEEHVPFHLTMVGKGNMAEYLSRIIVENNLENEIELIASLSPREIRERMIASNIFLFTSDQHEGWGVVLNEAMNSGCAVVASSEIGSVPFLMKDGVNGLIYKDGNFNDLYQKTKELCLDPDKRKKIGAEAYNTIAEQWNASVATRNFLKLASFLLGSENKFPYISDSEPCSVARIIKDTWYE